MKYIHLRSQHRNNERHALTRDPIKPPSRFCAVSIGYTTVTNPDTDELVIQGQVSYCKRPDTFNRRLSHKIIEGRMKKYGPCIKVAVPEGFTIMEVLSRMFHPDFGTNLPNGGR